MLIDDEVSQTLSRKPISAETVIPKSVIASLYPYQQLGFRWMAYMLLEGCGCILGDEMGLGQRCACVIQIVIRCFTEKILLIMPLLFIFNHFYEISKCKKPLLLVKFVCFNNFMWNNKLNRVPFHFICLHCAYGRFKC